ncbi:MAG TPA: hypothetical protein VLF89_05040 [Candidatus Saccharimonadales bacterium]|nr:hypothetical protein [Candidatus Saccharimonadales bacterium]
MRVKKDIPSSLKNLGLKTSEITNLVKELNIPLLALLEGISPSSQLSKDDLQGLEEISSEVILDEESYSLERVRLGFFYFLLGQFQLTKELLENQELSTSEKLLLAQTQSKMKDFASSNNLLAELIVTYNEYSASAYLCLAKNALQLGNTLNQVNSIILIGVARAKKEKSLADAAKILFGFSEMLKEDGQIEQANTALKEAYQLQLEVSRIKQLLDNLHNQEN